MTPSVLSNANENTFADEWVLLLPGAVSFRAVAQDDRAARIAKQMAVATLRRWDGESQISNDHNAVD